MDQLVNVILVIDNVLTVLQRALDSGPGLGLIFLSLDKVIPPTKFDMFLT